jgi:hypothetical protein
MLNQTENRNVFQVPHNSGVGQFIDSQFIDSRFIDSQFIDRPFYQHPV